MNIILGQPEKLHLTQVTGKQKQKLEVYNTNVLFCGHAQVVELEIGHVSLYTVPHLSPGWLNPSVLCIVSVL